MYQPPPDFVPRAVPVADRPRPFPPKWVKPQKYTDAGIFQDVDEHAIKVSKVEHRNFRELLWDLVFSQQFSDLEKIRVIFRWMTSKNMYTMSFTENHQGGPEDILTGFRTRKSTYARIFEIICCYAGVHCTTLTGYAKGVDYRPGMKFSSSPYNHSWNVVFVDGAWQLVDSHWATRYLQSEKNTPENLVYEYDDFYFLTDPQQLIYSHWPEDSQWQLLHRSHSLAEFEDLPLAKSHFFKCSMQFWSNNHGVVPTLNGKLVLTLGFTQRISFTYKLVFGDSVKEIYQGIKLNRYILQETLDNQVNFYVRLPIEGPFYLTIYSQKVSSEINVENVFNAACEYKVICDRPAEDASPYPLTSDTNWGPGAPVNQLGLSPSQKNGVLTAVNGRVEMRFSLSRPIRLLGKLLGNNEKDGHLDEFITHHETNVQSVFSIELPHKGEYALEIYANDPAQDDSTFTHICQYLLQYSSDDQSEQSYGTLTLKKGYRQSPRKNMDIKYKEGYQSLPRNNRPIVKEAYGSLGRKGRMDSSSSVGSYNDGYATMPNMGRRGSPSSSGSGSPRIRGRRYDPSASGEGVALPGMNEQMAHQIKARGDQPGSMDYEAFEASMRQPKSHTMQVRPGIGSSEYESPVRRDQYDQRGQVTRGPNGTINTDQYRGDQAGRTPDGAVDRNIRDQYGRGDQASPLGPNRGVGLYSDPYSPDSVGRGPAGSNQRYTRDQYDQGLEASRQGPGGGLYAEPYGGGSAGRTPDQSQQRNITDQYAEINKKPEPLYAEVEKRDRFESTTLGHGSNETMNRPASQEYPDAQNSTQQMGLAGTTEVEYTIAPPNAMTLNQDMDKLALELESATQLQSKDTTGSKPKKLPPATLPKPYKKPSGQVSSVGMNGSVSDLPPPPAELVAGQDLPPPPPPPPFPSIEDLKRSGSLEVLSDDKLTPTKKPGTEGRRSPVKVEYVKEFSPNVRSAKNVDQKPIEISFTGGSGFPSLPPAGLFKTMANEDDLKKTEAATTRTPAGTPGYVGSPASSVGTPGSTGYESTGYKTELHVGKTVPGSGDYEEVKGIKPGYAQNLQGAPAGSPSRAYSQAPGHGNYENDEDLPPPPPPPLREDSIEDQISSKPGSYNGNISALDMSKNFAAPVPESFKPVRVEEVKAAPEPLPPPLPPSPQQNQFIDHTTAFKTIDRHAFEVSKTEQNSFRDLIWQLIYSRNINNDMAKARAIFLWLCTKDLSKMTFTKVEPNSPEEILMNLKEGQATYAVIFETLCSYAGLHCKIIGGYAKGADYKPGMKFSGSTAHHSWNAVFIDGHWRLVDCHWAARRMIGKKGIENVRYELDEYYFMIDPRQLVYTHYPDDSNWQLLSDPLTLNEFENLPPVKSLFFKYGLDLLSHKNAIIYTEDEVNIQVGFSTYAGRGLEFHFNLSCENSEEELNGIKMSRYGLQETGEKFASFRVRVPEEGSYKFVIYAKEVGGEAPEKMYSAVCEYNIICDSTPIDTTPFPPCSSSTWGLTLSAAHKYGIRTTQVLAMVSTQNGQSEIRYKLTKQLLFMAKLRSNDINEKDLEGCILHRVVGDTAIFSISVPKRGEYGLEIFTNEPEKDGKTLFHMCQYFVVCNENNVSGMRFPTLPSAYLGAQPSYTKLGMQALSHPDPLINDQTGEVEVQFKLQTPLRVTCNLIATVGSQEYPENILQQTHGELLTFVIRMPSHGIYKFQIYAQPIDDKSDSLPGVYNYLINCGDMQGPSIAFPRQFAQWKEGCYLYEPRDGNLSAEQHVGTNIMDKNFTFFKMHVPKARMIAVVIGDEWTQLEEKSVGSWEGTVHMTKHWGKDHRLAVTANFGGSTTSYNTLLEYTM